MTQKINNLLIYLLLLLTGIAGCNSVVPQAQETKAQIEIPQASWHEISGNGVVLELPQDYFGGNPRTEIDEITSQLKTIAPIYEEKITEIKQNSHAIALLAFDRTSGKAQIPTNVNITTDRSAPEETIEDYLDRLTTQLSSLYRIQDQKLLSLEDYQAGRIVAEAEINQTRIKQLFYTIKNDDTFWIVTYTTTAEQFERRLPDFEKSMRTLKITS
ncbi:DUF1795 domain-containing protein [Oscillatoria salina]|uniref:DUF1795 domain-containing protein n=1 Tax=Oscillatoria salina TaxID=331517 RepID=UPI0013BB0DE1|nr:DUF1795 domain-containing protein [Oscillatoria salina]MBZ8179900.1 DUF1795 domain-containing protein [Oscillatoria salina IIICB1]NET87447.1 DUF1795 domain-containing protein [Kamptonema sp. SIO1D9]